MVALGSAVLGVGGLSLFDAQRGLASLRPAVVEGARALLPGRQSGVSFRRQFALCGQQKRITCVVDGDTFWLDGEKIRIADLDAPEIGEPHCRSEYELGMRATRRLVELLNAGPFEIRISGTRDRDAYGRALRVVVRDGRSLGGQLVQEGLARRWTGRRRPWC